MMNGSHIYKEKMNSNKSITKTNDFSCVNRNNTPLPFSNYVIEEIMCGL